jgi:two-component system alkaline phosphatase synthesis response regulator PhoP
MAVPVRRHVLVADDEPHIGRIIQLKLEQGPFRVTLAQGGVEALETLQGPEPIDAVLLDLMMPVVSGFDVLSRMRSDERWRDIPCVVLTAAGQDAHRERALLLGATEFMTKPFSPKKLFQRLAELTGADLDPPREGLS